MFEKNSSFVFFGLLFFLVLISMYYFLFPKVKLGDCSGSVSFESESYLIYFVPLLSISLFSSIYLKLLRFSISLSDLMKLFFVVVLFSYLVIFLFSDSFVFFGIRKIIEIKTCYRSLIGPL
jgi:hypothetical protein